MGSDHRSRRRHRQGLADPGAAEVVEDITGRLDIGLVVLAAGFGTTGCILDTGPRVPITLGR